MNKSLEDFTSIFEPLGYCKTYLDTKGVYFVAEVSIELMGEIELNVNSEIRGYRLKEVLISAKRTRLIFE